METEAEMHRDAGGRRKGPEGAADKRGGGNVVGAGPSPTVRPQKTGRADRVQTNRRAIQSESGLPVWALGSGIVGRRDRNQRSELREMLGRQGGTGGGGGGEEAPRWSRHPMRRPLGQGPDVLSQ